MEDSLALPWPYPGPTCVTCNQTLPSYQSLPQQLIRSGSGDCGGAYGAYGAYGYCSSYADGWSSPAMGSSPVTSTAMGGGFESPVCLPNIAYMLDSPLNLLPTPPPTYASAECARPYPGFAGGWSQNQFKGLPTPCSTPPPTTLSRYTRGASQHQPAPPAPPAPPQTPGLLLDDVSPAPLSPFSCRPAAKPSTDPEKSASDIIRDANIAVGNTVEGRKAYAEISAMGLTEQKMRLVWIYYCGVKWRVIASYESEIEGEDVPYPRLMMRLRRLRKKYRRIKEMTPLRT